MLCPCGYPSFVYLKIIVRLIKWVGLNIDYKGLLILEVSNVIDTNKPNTKYTIINQNQLIMNKTKLTSILAMGIISLFSFSCQKSAVSVPENATVNASPNGKTSAMGPWTRQFTDDFTATGSFNNWVKTSRFDYNSNVCQYDAAVPAIANYDGRNVLVLTATKSGNIWKSGHVKSNYSFKPNVNEEYRVSSQIKLVALNGANYTGFSSTYGVWPAFWTVQETAWPTKGEIDIFEGYSYGGTTKFASNLFYGANSGTNQLGNTAERAFGVNEGWHMYDEYWKNVNGTVTVTIQLDGATVSTYTNSVNGNLRLENFGPHNIIFNVCVGDNYGIFNNANINVFTKTMMWVDYVTVDKRTL